MEVEGTTGHKTRSASAVMASLLCLAMVASIVVFALRADGHPGTETSTNDGGAWLVNRRAGSIGHVNRQVEELSAAVQVGDPRSRIEVFQPGGFVVAYDQTGNRLSVIDERVHQLINTIELPPGTRIHHYAGGLVAHAESPRRVWIIPVESLGDIVSLDDLPPAHTDDSTGRDALVAVSATGTVLVAPGDGSLLLIDARTTVDPDPVQVSDSAPRFHTTTLISPAENAAGGIEHIAFDGEAALIVTRSGMFRVSSGGDGERIEPLAGQVGTADWLTAGVGSPTATGTVIAVDAEHQVVSIDTRSGESQVLGRLGGASPGAPLEHGDCVYAVASDPGELWVRCGEQVTTTPLATEPGAELRLRVENGWVWLNDLTTGRLWLVDDDAELRRIDDWGSVLPNQDADGEDSSPTGTDEDIVDELLNPDADDAQVVDADDFDEDGVNQPPVAFDDEARTSPSRPVIIDVVDNDTDPDHDVLLITSVTDISDAGARIDVSSDGTQVQVSSTVTGTLRFSYTISDGRGGADSATVTVVVEPRTGATNEAPIAVTDVAAIAVGDRLVIDVVANDYDPDGDTLVLVDATAAEGTVNFDPSGQLIYEPAGDASEGLVELSYVIADDFGEEATGTVRVAVRLEDSNRPPDARNDGTVAVVGQPVSLNLLANDLDPDGDDLFIGERPTLISPADAQIFTTVSPDGQFVVIPDAPGTYLFSYAASDGEASDLAQIRVEVSEAESNRPPVGLRDDIVVPLGQSRIAHVLANDRDPDGDVIGIVDVDVPPGSGLRIEPYSDVGFRVQVDAEGPARRTFTYWISDGLSDPVPVTVVVAVASVVGQDNPPIAEPDSVEVRAGAAVAVPVLENDFDPEGGPLQVVAVSDPDQAQVSIAADGQTVRIQVDAAAVTSFTIGYDVADEAGNRTASIVRVRVVPAGEPNRPPIARPDRALTEAGQPVEIEVLINDSDPDGDPIVTQAITAQPTAGRAEIDRVTGRVIYVPTPGFIGTDHFAYSIVDGFGAVAIGEVLVGVLEPPESNRNPVAIDDSYLTIATGQRIDLDVLANDSDPDGDQLRIAGFDRAEAGGVGDVESGESVLSYVSPTQLGEDTTVVIVYRISDGQGGSAEATITILVQATPDPEEIDDTTTLAPLAVDDLVGPVPAETEVAVDVVANDSDPDTPLDLLVVQVDPTAAADLRVEGSTVIFTATESTAFDYQITDPDGNVASAQVIVTVIDSLAPIALDDVAGPVPEGEEIVVDVLVNDSDPDAAVGAGAGLVIVGVAGPNATSDGQLITIVAPEQTAQYTYTIQDVDGLEASAVLSLIVTENQPPTVEPVTVETEFETPIVIDLVVGADPDGDPLLYSCCQTAFNGSPTVLSAGENDLGVEFTPDDGFAGEAGFSFEVSDGFGHQVAGSVTVIVAEQPNRPPTAADADASIQVPRPDGPPIEVTVDLAALSDDPDPDDVLAWQISSAPGNGLTAAVEDSTLVLTATDSSSPGDTTVGYTVTDLEGESAEAIIAVTVEPPQNNPPTAADDQVTVAAGDTTVIALGELSGDPDADDVLTYDISPSPTAGTTITLTSASSVTVAAAITATGQTPAFDYMVTDRLGEQAQGRVNLTVGEPEQPPPAAVDDTATTLQGQAVVIDVLANDTDPLGQGLTILAPGFTSDGTTATVGNGIRFMPASDFFGTTTFTYTVRDAADIANREAAATVSVEVTGRPDRPSPPQCSPDAGEATVTWTAPAGNGAPVTGYTLAADPAHGDLATPIQLSGNSTTITGLSNGTSYRFRVLATNVAGDSEWSTWSSGCIPDIEPEQPSPPTVTHGDGWLELTWVPPHNEGTPITEYEVRIGGGTVQRTSDTTLRWTGLDNGTDYTFQIAARNDKGRSPFSRQSAPEHPSTVPSRPSIEATTRAGLIGATASGILQVNWTPVGTGDDGGDPVIEYRIEQRNGPTRIVSGANSDHYVWSGLSNGVDHQFRVVAVNRDGSSQASTWSAPLAACTTPAAPTNPSATSTDGRAQVSFAAPIDDGGCAITNYRLRIQGESSNRLNPSAPGTFTITGLSNGTTYSFEVRAVNTVGSGPWVATNATTPAGPPTCEASFHLSRIDHDGALVYFDPADANGAPSVSYETNTNRGGWAVIDPISTLGSLGATLPGPIPNAQNTVELRAVTENGTDHCGSITFTSCTHPPAPPKPDNTMREATSGHGIITFYWEQSVQPCHTQSQAHADTVVRRYEYRYRTGGPIADDGLQRTIILNGQDRGTKLRVQVRACDAVLCGPWSAWSDYSIVPGTVRVHSTSVSSYCTYGQCPGTLTMTFTLSDWADPVTFRCYHYTASRWVERYVSYSPVDNGLYSCSGADTSLDGVATFSPGTNDRHTGPYPYSYPYEFTEWVVVVETDIGYQHHGAIGSLFAETWAFAN